MQPTTPWHKRDIRWTKAWPLIFLGAIVLYALFAPTADAQTFNPFDDASGNARDLTRIGTPTENVTSGTNRYGSGVGDTLSAYANRSAPSGLGAEPVTSGPHGAESDMALLLAFNQTTGGSIQTIVEQTGNSSLFDSTQYEVQVAGNGRIIFLINSAGDGLAKTCETAASLITADTVHSIAISVDDADDEVRIWHQGALVKTCTGWNFPFLKTDKAFTVGGRDAGTQVLNGNVFEIRVWNTTVPDQTLVDLSTVDGYQGCRLETEAGLFFFEVITLSSCPLTIVHSNDCCTNLQDVAVDNEPGAAADVYVRDPDLELIRQFSFDLTIKTGVDACSGTRGHADTSNGLGLTVTVDGFVAALCRSAFSQDMRVSLHNSNLTFISAKSPGLTLGSADNTFCSQTANNITTNGRRSNPTGFTQAVALYDAPNQQTTFLRDFANTQGVCHDRTGTGRTVAVSTGGTRVYSPAGILIASDNSVQGIGGAIHGDFIYVGSSGQVRKYNYTSGSLALNGTQSAPTNVEQGHIRISHDGSFVLTWSTADDTIWVINATDMSLVTTGTLESVRAADMRHDNEMVYAVNATHVVGFDFADFAAFDPGGVGGGDTSQGDVVPPAPEVEFPGFDAGGFAEAAGVTESAAGWFIAILWIVILGGVLFTFTQSPTGFAIGGFAGFGLSAGVGLIPLWAVFLVIVAGGAILLFFRGGR